ncbi:hypothetical protein [Pinibacter soli]|uniref:Uncharacterized protein n=1 Tax=Pinibacter soli TaxID=3044211 RepID=A0ABT6RHN7_9BACT|nr:hypothetical protein [Pinibacter soli]MDI3321359.1 hypothetical protein [Pinibacter soli]
MFQLFKRHKKPASPLCPFWNKTALVIQARQRRLASWLEQRTRLWSKRTWQTVLIFFCIGAFIIGGWLIRVAFVNTPNTISVQELIKPPPIVPIETRVNNTQKTLHYLQQLKCHVDSLKQNEKNSFEELIKKEPRLLDSLNGLIELYNEQLK